MSINLIGTEVVRTYTNGQAWSIETSQQLAQNIAKKVDLSKINIRHVQPMDNLGRIAEGLSLGKIKPLEEGGKGWAIVPITYLGNSTQIEDQKIKNSDGTLIKASLIHPGQYVSWQKDCVWVADNIELILNISTCN